MLTKRIPCIVGPKFTNTQKFISFAIVIYLSISVYLNLKLQKMLKIHPMKKVLSIFQCWHFDNSSSTNHFQHQQSKAEYVWFHWDLAVHSILWCNISPVQCTVNFHEFIAFETITYYSMRSTEHCYHELTEFRQFLCSYVSYHRQITLPSKNRQSLGWNHRLEVY